MDDAAVRRAVDSWWRARAYACFEQAVDRYLPAFGGRVAKPTITVKKLTSKWGSCATQRAHINLNYYLLRAPEMCIDYVVVHELAHFLELAHDARFYKIVGSILPGWKDCRAALGLERLR